MIRNKHSNRSLKHARRVVLTLVLTVALIAAPFAASGAAQENQTDPAPYYNNSSQTEVHNETWMADNEDATFENITTFVSRVGTFVIGSDVDDSNSPTAPLVIGLTLLGAGLGVTVGTGIGIVGGAVLGIISIFGVSAIGVFPAWFYAIGLFGVGLLLSASFKRVVA